MRAQRDHAVVRRHRNIGLFFVGVVNQLFSRNDIIRRADLHIASGGHLPRGFVIIAQIRGQALLILFKRDIAL